MTRVIRILRQLRAWARRKVVQVKIGFDPIECWSLDTCLAEWLSKRLRYLSCNSCGAPCGYPHLDGREDTDFEAWRRDLLNAANDLLSYSKKFESIGDKEEDEKIRAGVKAMKWVAKWFPNLWD